VENIARKLGLQINQEETKYVIVERKNKLKQKHRAFENKKLQV
jgi:hypothetical protein